MLFRSPIACHCPVACCPATMLPSTCRHCCTLRASSHCSHVLPPPLPFCPTAAPLEGPSLLKFHPSLPHALHACPHVLGPNTAYPCSLVLRQPPTTYFPMLGPHPWHAHIPHQHTAMPHDVPQAPPMVAHGGDGVKDAIRGSSGMLHV